MKIFIQTHSYLINMDNVAYFRAFRTSEVREGCCFRMTNGRTIEATCSYDVVIDALNSHRYTSDTWESRTCHQNMVIITLDY